MDYENRDGYDAIQSLFNEEHKRRMMAELSTEKLFQYHVTSRLIEQMNNEQLLNFSKDLLLDLFYTQHLTQSKALKHFIGEV